MLEKEIKVSVDKTENNIENELSNIRDKKINDTSKLSSDNNIEDFQAVITEVPDDNNLREGNGDSHGKRKKHTMVYNYRENEPPRRGTYRQYDSSDTLDIPKRAIGSPSGFGGGYEMGPPLDYDPDSRNGFVRLVMMLLLLMLIVTALFIAYVRLTPSLMEFFQSAGWMLSMFALIMLLGLNYAVACSPCVRVPPGNFIFLLLTVIAMSIITAQITSFYKTDIILHAVIVTAAVVFVCFLLAFTSFDFTTWMLYVVVIATALSVIGLIVFVTMAITGVVMKPVILGYLILATLLETIMLTIELQTVLGGKTVELSEDDYALGAFMLYTSIISIFLKMVQILGILENQ